MWATTALFRNPRRPPRVAPQHSADSFYCTLSCWPRRSQVKEASQLRLRGMRRYHFAGRFSQVRHADAGRKNGGVRLCHPLDRHPQPPLLFCDTLPDCSVILRLSSNYSPLFVAHFYAFRHSSLANTLFIRTFPVMSRCLRAGSSILFGHVLFDLLLLLPTGSGQLTHFVILWHTVQQCNIPLRQVFAPIPPATAPGIPTDR